MMPILRVLSFRSLLPKSQVSMKNKQPKIRLLVAAYVGLTKQKPTAIYFSSCDFGFSIAKSNNFILHLFSQ